MTYSFWSQVPCNFIFQNFFLKKSHKDEILSPFAYFLGCYFLFWDRVSCSPGWLRTPNVAKEDPELLILLPLQQRCGITGQYHQVLVQIPSPFNQTVFSAGLTSLNVFCFVFMDQYKSQRKCAIRKHTNNYIRIDIKRVSRKINF